MPRRKALAGVIVAATLALVVTSGALAGNGGIGPPPPHSPNTERISDTYYFVLAITGAIFLLVEGALLVFVIRFRNRGRDRAVEGPQIRGHTRLEIVWTAIPILILATIAGFTFYKLPGIKNVPGASAAGDELDVRVTAHQFYWQFNYGSGAVSIDELRVPVNRVVRIAIDSEDVDHSWWIPELHAKFDAIPGQTNHTWFKAEEKATYRGQCGEFCGIFHAQMTARVVATSQQEFRDWIDRRARQRLGRAEWEGACAKCHGLTGKGDYGPAIAGNPLLTQRANLETLVREGRNRPDTPGVMPPVARGWSDAQLDALIRYLRKGIAKSAEGVPFVGG